MSIALVFLASIALQPWNCVYSANILGLMGMTSPSHHIWNSVLLHELAARGHNVTILSADLPRDLKTVPENVTYIHLERAYDFNKDEEEPSAITSYMNSGYFEIIVPYYEFGLKTAKSIAASEGIDQLLSYPNDFQFDLIIYDYTLGPYLLGFAHKFCYPPIIGVSAYHHPPHTIDFMGGTFLPAITPYHWTSYSAQMGFRERLHNTLIFAADTIYRRWYYNPQLDGIMSADYGPNMPSLNDIAERTVIALVNSHPAIDYMEALQPNVIEVGGMHLGPVKELPKKLDNFMRAGKSGAVLFSLGTNMKSSSVNPSIVQEILEAFRQLTDYRIIWKFDKSYLKDLNVPSNVFVSSFLPQSDILAHESLRVFVTHCGALSIQEATWHGVPLVGLPLFLDQHRNLRQSIDAGVAVGLDFKNMASNQLVEAIETVAQSQDMLKAMSARSARFRNNPIPPLDLAVWWVEYLLRQPQPQHLRSRGKDLSYFETHSLDVLAILLLGFWLLYNLLLEPFKTRRTRRRH